MTIMNNLNNPSIWMNKGEEYLNGGGGEINHSLAIECFKKAFENGYSNASLKIGEIYCFSNKVEDFENADFWFKKTLNQFSLGIKYLDIGEKLLEKLFYVGENPNGGHLHKYKPEKAFYWFNKAAELGNGDAMFQLALCYSKGQGVEKNHLKSFEWYEKAYDNNCTNQISTLIALANFYKIGFVMNGIVVKKNLEMAMIYYNRALCLCQEEIDSYDDLPNFYIDHDHLNYLNNRILEIKERKKSINIEPKAYYLFFDVETTGIPINWKASYTETENWPRIIQIAWMLIDEFEQVIEINSEIIKPTNFVIPTSSIKIHGITTEQAMKVGKDLDSVLTSFKKSMELATLVVAHNISFDINVVGAEFYRLYKHNPLTEIKSFCTMESSLNICKIRNGGGYKYPKLQELYSFLFNQNYHQTHDALSDTIATSKCFFEIKRKKLIRFISIFLFALVASNLTSCNNQYTSEELALIKIERKNFQQYKQEQIEIKNAIFSNKFNEADSLIRNFLKTNIGEEYKVEIGELMTLNYDRKLYIKIVKERDLKDILKYQNSNKFYQYESEVKKIKNEIDQNIFLAASSAESIDELKMFLLENPENNFINEAKSLLRELERKQKIDSILRDKEFREIMVELNNSKYKNDNTFSNFTSRSFSNFPNLNNVDLNYRNPNSAPPIIKVEGYYRSNGTYVNSYMRTPPNDTKTDNLRYRKL